VIARPFALPIGAEAVISSWMSASLPRSFVEQIGPDAFCLGLAGARRQTAIGVSSVWMTGAVIMCAPIMAASGINHQAT
jgi:hypothetical protein